MTDPLTNAMSAGAAGALAGQLARNEQDGFTELFHAAHSPAPILIWSPDTEILENAAFDRFARICDDVAAAGGTSGAVDRAAFDLNAFGTIQDWIMLLRRTDDGGLVYDHYGAGIARIYGKDMTGRAVGGFPPHITTFFNACYDAVAQRKERLLSIHQPPRQVFVSTWRRLIVPLLEDGRCTGFAVLNQPTNELRDGLEVVPAPVLIADHAKIVRYANKAARQCFDAGNYGPWDQSLFDYAALDLDIAESPEQIMRYGITHERRARSVRHQKIEYYSAAITAARHHATAFYVILLYPDPVTSIA